VRCGMNVYEENANMDRKVGDKKKCRPSFRRTRRFMDSKLIIEKLRTNSRSKGAKTVCLALHRET